MHDTGQLGLAVFPNKVKFHWTVGLVNLKLLPDQKNINIWYLEGGGA